MWAYIKETGEFGENHQLTYLFTVVRCQARHYYVAKQFGFLNADCLVVGESQGSSVVKYPVKPPGPGDSQTIGT